MKRIWEIIVAVFVLLGIALTVHTAVKLVRSTLENTYPLLVHINDAGGIEKGAPVEYGGIRIGKVTKKPYFKPDYTGLLVPLAIDAGVQIPAETIALIDNTGSGPYIKMPLPEHEVNRETGEVTKKSSGNYVESGDILNGFRIDRDEIQQKSLSDTLARFEKSMESLNTTSVALERVLNMMERGNSPDAPDTPGITALPILPGGAGGGSLASVNRTMDSLEKTNEKLSKSVDNFDRLLLRATPVVDGMNNSIIGFDKSMVEVAEMANNGDRTFQRIYEVTDENAETFQDFQSATNEFRDFIANADALLAKVENGNGLMKTLVNDPCFDQDVRQLVDKLERHGVMFYPREKKLRATLVTKNSISNPMMRRR